MIWPARRRKEIASADADIDRLAKIIPPVADVDAFLYQLDSWLAPFELERCGDLTTSEWKRDFYDETTLRLQVCGPGSALDSVSSDPTALTSCCGERLVRLKALDEIDDRIDVKLVIFSMPAMKDAVHKDLCDEARWPKLRCWLWPLRGRAEAAREGLAEACPEISERRELIERVDELEARRQYLMRSIEIVKALNSWQPESR